MGRKEIVKTSIKKKEKIVIEIKLNSIYYLKFILTHHDKRLNNLKTSKFLK